MAMYLGRQIFRQAARRFVAGIGGNLRSSTFLAGAPRIARSYHRLPSYMIDTQMPHVSPVARYASIAMISLFGYSYYNERFVAGLGENLRSSNFLAGAREKVRTFHRLLPPYEADFSMGPYYPGAKFLTIAIINICGYMYNGRQTQWNCGSPPAIVEPPEPSAIVENNNDAEKKMMEEMGITRELSEAKIAELKPKIELGSASWDERIALQIYKEWLRGFTKGEEKYRNALGSS